MSFGRNPPTGNVSHYHLPQKDFICSRFYSILHCQSVIQALPLCISSILACPSLDWHIRGDKCVHSEKRRSWILQQPNHTDHIHCIQLSQSSVLRWCCQNVSPYHLKLVNLLFWTAGIHDYTFPMLIWMNLIQMALSKLTDTSGPAVSTPVCLCASTPLTVFFTIFEIVYWKTDRPHCPFFYKSVVFSEPESLWCQQCASVAAILYSAAKTNPKHFMYAYLSVVWAYLHKYSSYRDNCCTHSSWPSWNCP